MNKRLQKIQSKRLNKGQWVETNPSKIVLDGYDYLLSDEPVEEGGWYYHIPTKMVYRNAKNVHIWDEEARKESKKVVATNNPDSIKLGLSSIEKRQEGGKTTLSLKDELQKNIQEIFPESLVHVSVRKHALGGGNYIAVYVTLGKNKEEYPNDIANNDSMYHSIIVDGVDESGNPKGDKVNVEGGQSGYILIKSTNPMLAFERIKTGWRNFSGNREQVVKRLTDYFKKLKQTLIENKDKLTDHAKNLVEQKYAVYQEGGSISSEISDVLKQKISSRLRSKLGALMLPPKIDYSKIEYRLLNENEIEATFYTNKRNKLVMLYDIEEGDIIPITIHVKNEKGQYEEMGKMTAVEFSDLQKGGEINKGKIVKKGDSILVKDEETGEIEEFKIPQKGKEKIEKKRTEGFRIERDFGVHGMYKEDGRYVRSLFTGAETLEEGIELGKKMFPFDERLSRVEISNRKGKIKVYAILTKGDNGEIKTDIDKEGNLLTKQERGGKIGNAEQLIHKYNLSGKGVLLMFKNDPKFYFSKNLTENRKRIFVTDDSGQTFNKNLLDIVRVQNTYLQEGGIAPEKDFIKEHPEVLMQHGSVLYQTAPPTFYELQEDVINYIEEHYDIPRVVAQRMVDKKKEVLKTEIENRAEYEVPALARLVIKKPQKIKFGKKEGGEIKKWEDIELKEAEFESAMRYLNIPKNEWEQYRKDYFEGGGKVETPRALGTALKRYFKDKYGIDIETRYVKTVRGLDDSWYEISTFSSGHIIPNEVRKELLELSHGKPISELGVQNPNDIYYGNIRGERLSVYGKHWKEWLKSKMSMEQGGEINVDVQLKVKLTQEQQKEILEREWKKLPQHVLTAFRIEKLVLGQQWMVRIESSKGNASDRTFVDIDYDFKIIEGNDNYEIANSNGAVTLYFKENQIISSFQNGGEVEVSKNEIKVKTLKGEHSIPVEDITADEALNVVKSQFPDFTEFEYKRYTYKKYGKGGEFLRKIEPPEVIEARWKKKKDHIRQLANDIHRLKLNVTRDLSSGKEKDFLVATILSIMLRTGERIGNGNSAENGHFGVTYLKKKHIDTKGNQVVLNYVGKSGVKHEKMFSDSRISQAIKRAIKNSPNSFVFTTSKGQKITEKQVNEYLKEFSITGKDIRGYSSNRWILDKLKEVKPEETEKKRKKQFNKVLRQVAAKVGHGPATLRKHYMMPEIFDTWMQKGKVFNIKGEGYATLQQGGGVAEKLGVSDEQAKNISHLPFEFAVYIPSTQDVSGEISKEDLNRRVEKVKKYLSDKFGGFSSSNVEGGYVTKEEQLIEEKIVKVTAFSTKKAFDKNKNELLAQLSSWAKEWGQEAIGLEFEGDLMYVPQKLQTGGTTNEKSEKEMIERAAELMKIIPKAVGKEKDAYTREYISIRERLENPQAKSEGGKIDTDEFWKLLEYTINKFSDYPKIKKYLSQLSTEIDRSNYRPIFGYTNGTFFSPIVDKTSYWLDENFDNIKNNKKKRVLSKTENYFKPYLVENLKNYGIYKDKNFRPYFAVRYELNLPFSYPEKRGFKNAEQIFRIAKKMFEENPLKNDYDIQYYGQGDYIDINIIKKIKKEQGGEIKYTSDGSKGGMFDGPSHKNGGMRTIVMETGEIIEVEGEEPLIVPETMRLKQKVRCVGKPKSVASAINEMGGGDSFSHEEAQCELMEEKGGEINKKPFGKKRLDKLKNKNKKKVTHISGKVVSAPAGAAVINKTSTAMKETVVCEGTPGGIASSINELGGHGVKFSNEGKCRVIKEK